MNLGDTFKIEKNGNGQKIAIDPCNEPCPIERGMRIIGGKWTGSILWHLKDEPVRFNDLSRQMQGASKKMIVQRLKEMEERKLVVRTVISTQPIAVTYQITELGQTAIGFLSDLMDWVETHNL